jgi:hypothetical protein
VAGDPEAKGSRTVAVNRDAPAGKRKKSKVKPKPWKPLNIKRLSVFNALNVG